MSQAKVDRYKEEKKNRKKIMAKEKRMRIAGYVAVAVLSLPVSSAGPVTPDTVLMRQTSLWKPFMQTLIPLQTI